MAHEITITPVGNLVTVRTREGALLAASENALRLEEDGYPPVIYLPLENALAGALTPRAKKTTCPFKGEAAYFAVRGSDLEAWIYYAPLPERAAIAGHVAFPPDRVTATEDALPPLPREAEDLLDFWFEETSPAKHFKADPAFDQTLRDRFGDFAGAAATGGLDGWTATPRGTLGLLLLLDQLPRNLHRGTAEAFAQDPAAQQIATAMAGKGWDLALPPAQRAFAYMPLMHAEDLALQNDCVTLFAERLPGSTSMPYALSHRADIHRHGRFPYRDEALGR